MSRADAPPAMRWTAYIAIAIIFAIACAFLSNWQFTRNAERTAQLALVEANYDQTPVALTDLLAPGAALEPGDEWRPVELTGRYLPDDQLLVRNRPHGGTAAFEVLVPFRLDDGRVMIVNRGWVRPGREQPDPDVVPAPPEGAVSVVVRLRPSEPSPASGRSAPAGQVARIDLPMIAGIVSPDAASLEQGAYGLMVSEDPAVGRPEPIASPSEDPGPYLSYAIQWILFAIMGFGFLWYVIRTERRHRKEDAEDPDAARRRRIRRRTDRDADEEDALLETAGTH